MIDVLLFILLSAAHISDKLSMYDQVDKLAEPTPLSNKYSAPFGTRPRPDSNPYNAWSVTSSLPRPLLTDVGKDTGFIVIPVHMSYLSLNDVSQIVTGA